MFYLKIDKTELNELFPGFKITTDKIYTPKYWNIIPLLKTDLNFGKLIAPDDWDDVLESETYKYFCYIF
jgi:hypothetical protein